jgi:hypothetical protein
MMLKPFRTIDKDQADRCTKACATRTTITETFGSVVVTGEVQSVVDNRDSSPRNWSVTFINASAREI